jgi:hypothetical protein
VARGNEWVDVGVIEAESGTCLIIDPAFHRDGFYGEAQVGKAIDDARAAGSKTAPMALPSGHPVGIVLLPGYGDDAYRVEVRYVDDDRGGQRIAEMRVRFIKDK